MPTVTKATGATKATAARLAFGLLGGAVLGVLLLLPRAHAMPWLRALPRAAVVAGDVSPAPVLPALVEEPPAVRAFRLTQRDPYDAHILAAAIVWDLDPFVLKGLFWVESRLDPTRVNTRTGAAGIAQLTAGGRHAVKRLREKRGLARPFTRVHALDPTEAIPAAAELLSWMVDQYGLSGGLVAYNAGHGVRGQVNGFVRSVWRAANHLRAGATLPALPPPRRLRARGPEC